MRLRLPGLARPLLPARPPRARVAAVLCGAAPDGRAQQPVLPAAARRHLPGVGARGPGDVRLRRQGQPVPDAHQAPARARPTADALHAARERPRRPAVPPEPRAPRRIPGSALAAEDPRRGPRGAPCVVAHRLGLRAAGHRERRALPARLEDAAGHRSGHGRLRVRPPLRDAPSLRRLLRRPTAEGGRPPGRGLGGRRRPHALRLTELVRTPATGRQAA